MDRSMMICFPTVVTSFFDFRRYILSCIVQKIRSVFVSKDDGASFERGLIAL